jgi:L-alanine-DL-glutamate epimerase-like enolase superfamily enzyme
LTQLLGGFTRRAIRTYNTCAGTDYIKRPRDRRRQLGLSPARDYDDLDAFLHPRGRARAVPAGGGDHGHEDLAIRRAAERSRGCHYHRPEE